MSHFYGRIAGSRGEATRAGHKSSGINATVRTWSGNLTARLEHEHGRDVAYISLRPEHGYGVQLASLDFKAVLEAVQAGDAETLAALDAVNEAAHKLSQAAIIATA